MTHPCTNSSAARHRARRPPSLLAYTIDRHESASSDSTEITSIWTITPFRKSRQTIGSAQVRECSASSSFNPVRVYQAFSSTVRTDSYPGTDPTQCLPATANHRMVLCTMRAHLGRKCEREQRAVWNADGARSSALLRRGALRYAMNAMQEAQHALIKSTGIFKPIPRAQQSSRHTV
jgi:hypothetical protein